MTDEESYLIGDKEYPRIRYGDEKHPWTVRMEDGQPLPCHDCRVLPGDYHLPGCDVEECPKCGGQSISCHCDAFEAITPISPRIWCGACGATLVDVASPGVSQDAEGYWIVRGPGVVDAINAHRTATGHDMYNFTMRVALSADEYDRLTEAAVGSHFWSSPQRVYGERP